MQSKLATWSTEDKGRKFDRLLRLIADSTWLAEAARITTIHVRRVEIAIHCDDGSRLATLHIGSDVEDVARVAARYEVRKGVEFHRT